MYRVLNPKARMDFTIICLLNVLHQAARSRHVPLLFVCCCFHYRHCFFLSLAVFVCLFHRSFVCSFVPVCVILPLSVWTAASQVVPHGVARCKKTRQECDVL